MTRDSLSQEMALAMHLLSDEKEAAQWRAGGRQMKVGRRKAAGAKPEGAGPRPGVSIVSRTTVTAVTSLTFL